MLPIDAFFHCFLHLCSLFDIAVFGRDMDHSEGIILYIFHIVASTMYKVISTVLFQPGSPFKGSFYYLFVAGALVVTFALLWIII